MSDQLDERVLVLRPSAVEDLEQNHSLCLTSATSLGLKLTRDDLMDGKVPQLMSFISEVLRVYLLSPVHASKQPSLMQLREDKETVETFLNRLTPEVRVTMT